MIRIINIKELADGIMWYFMRICACLVVLSICIWILTWSVIHYKDAALARELRFIETQTCIELSGKYDDLDKRLVEIEKWNEPAQ